MSSALLAQVKVVLVRSFHPGNIGSAARAMKTMGLSQLVLVQPVEFPHPQAQTMAAGAQDTLERVQVVGSVLEAVADCTVVAACSARSRGYELPALTPSKCAAELLGAAGRAPVALMFGPERQGLSNDDLRYATHRVMIDANPEYPSLNLAAAVQLLAYELRQAAVQCAAAPAHGARQLPSAQSLQHYFERLEHVFRRTGFVIEAHPGELQKKLRHLYARAELDQQELNILQGMLSSVEQLLPEPSDKH